jgi:hypothetical protein
VHFGLRAEKTRTRRDFRSFMNVGHMSWVGCCMGWRI